MEGERKGEAHGEAAGVYDGTSVPMRRWEDWERSRLRKIKREERRRREMERAFPAGYQAGGMLGVGMRDDRSNSFYDDAMSVASTDDDQWGVQIGGYNENSPAYPPPPADVLLPRDELLAEAETIGGADLEAMLDSGWDNEDRSSNASSSQLLQANGVPGAPRYQLSDAALGPKPTFNAYAPMVQHGAGQYGMQQHAPAGGRTVMSPVSPTVPANGVSSAVGTDRQGAHARKRSGGGRPNAYGPLGPLDPGPGPGAGARF